MENANSRLMMTCEYLETPVGIMNPRPRFSWRVQGELQNTSQTSYRILVSLISGQKKEEVWDSKEQSSGRSTAIEYNGQPLRSRGQYIWEVTVGLKQEDGTGYRMTGTGRFEMGQLTKEDWKGIWIGEPAPVNGRAPMFRSRFKVGEPFEQGRLYISGLGYFEAFINGTKITDSVLDPGWTDYRKTVLYRAVDITELLVPGENVLAVVLGEGWLGNAHEGFQDLIGRMPEWLDTPKLLCDLWIDGRCVLASNEQDFRVSDGPVRQNNIYNGEFYDARLRKKGWKEAGYEETPGEWSFALPVPPPGGHLRCQLMPPIRETGRLEPVYIRLLDDPDVYHMTVDFGVNLSGWAQIEVKGKPGQQVVLRFAETLNPDGTVNQKNLRGAKAADTYVIGSSEPETFHPHFTYHGFRYVQIETDRDVLVDSVQAVRVCSDVRRNGMFCCSDDMVNRIYDAVIRTEENNMHSVPTDCPQRNERLGWMNDMTVRFEEGLYNFDTVLFYEKWLWDIADAQKEDGCIPDTIPYYYGDSPASHVSSVYLLLPWYLYRFYGDEQILCRHYSGMKRYLEFKLSQRRDNGLLHEKYMGEWAPPMTEAQLGWGENAVPKNISPQLVTTSYLYYDCEIMQKVSQTLGDPEYEAYCAGQAEAVKEAVNRAFLHEKEGYYDQNSQGANLFPLLLGITPDGCREKVLRHLLDDLIVKRDYHVSTGNQMTKYLYDLLNREKLDEVAYRLTIQKTYPSIGFMLEEGATTIWERWENMTGGHMNSHSHPMLGAFSTWFLKGLGGIRPGEESRKREYELEPALIRELSFAEASHTFMNGTLACRWERMEDRVVILAEVPWNSSVILKIPEPGFKIAKIIADKKVTKPGGSGVQKSIKLNSGRHRIELIPEDGR
ncbi:glycoside hydrolase family 78 protein [Lachnospiraceae bacterium ASD3451]|uniref:alpha-L-rhamnosidase n=1 Tax=Diplocloster agilis TaxID=2850323 RepID=UPI001DC26DBC|nr:alpha-L-rhamnosidase [Diplocloster agilis]MBU9743318.1 glycoside hydrolase family 78 protein [Diplocloster agilis]